MIKPSKEQVWRWGNEKANQWVWGKDDPNESREEFIARMAFAAGMEQAALICDHLYQATNSHKITPDDCAAMIRKSTEQKE